MKMSSYGQFPIPMVGETVRIAVPDVDRGKGDAKSILAIVMDRTGDGLYKLGSRQGMLRQLYVRSQFSVCEQKLLSMEEIKQDTTISLRAVANAQSAGTGQGMTRCSCKSGCLTKRCLCLKRKLICNSRCHNSLSCVNK